ncbi:MAG: AAA family ATPase [Gammaproteobacteria bacterium AqS3]|nr:AAA family ATPase [Gammaproteobacteria bacterium AqS3]
MIKGRSKDEILDEWKKVPELEIKHLKRSKFEVPFIHVRKLKKNKNKQLELRFLLDSFADSKASSDHIREKIKDIWEQGKALEISSSDELAFGSIYIPPKKSKARLVIALEDLSLSGWKMKEDQPGKLNLKGVDIEPLDYEFCWLCENISYFLIASKDNSFEPEQVGKKILGFLDKNKPDLKISIEPSSGAQFNTTGKLNSARMCLEVVMHGFKKIPEIPGRLYRNVHREIKGLKKQIDAVEKLRDGKIANPELENILLYPEISNQEPEPNYVMYGDLRLPINTEKGKIDGYFDLDTLRTEENDLDGNQAKAVYESLNQSPIFLVHGPPGTGKTKVIETIIRKILNRDDGKRILLCSKNNLAVDNVLERLMKETANLGGDVIRPVRLAAEESKISDLVQQIWLDNFWLQRKATLERTHLNRHLDSEEESFKRNFLHSRNVIGATCVHIAHGQYRELYEQGFDFVIMDEASTATPAEALIPILRAKQQLVLVGDHKQLPPFVTSDKKVWDIERENSPEVLEYSDNKLRNKYGKSLFEILIKGFEESEKEHFRSEEGQLYQMLNIQRRMPSQIGDLISKYFYEGKLASPKHQRNDQPLPFKKHPASILFIDISKSSDPKDNDDPKNRQNECSAEVIVETLKTLNRRLVVKNNKDKKDVAVIAGYRGQVELLENRVDELKLSKKFKGDIQVNTIDSFQGRENDIVIFDMVRSSPYKCSIGFLDDRRRLNVALSRAKELLIIVGDFDFLSNRAKPVWDANDPKDKKRRKKPLLKLIADEIKSKGLMFQSLDKALK